MDNQLEQEYDSLLEEIEQLHEKLHKARPLTKGQIQSLNEWLKVKMTYSSCAIEGNTLTESETLVVLKQGITVHGKTLNDHLEIVNHAKAIDFINFFALSKIMKITEEFICLLHGIIAKGLFEDSEVGVYRKCAVAISGSEYIPPSDEQVPRLMSSFLERFYSEVSYRNIIEMIAEFHFDFVSIHPFVDGNGRTVRLLMNILCMQHGYPIIIINPEDRVEYNESLKTGQLTGDLIPFKYFIANRLKDSFIMWLKITETESIPTSDYLKNKFLTKD